MKSSVVASVLSVLLFLSLSSHEAASGQEQATAEMAGFNLQAYSPARILISYTYTNNFSVTDVSSLGKSLYKIISGPVSIEFQAQDIDQYTFTVDIRYEVIVVQSVQIAVFSGTYAPEGIQLNVQGDTVRIRFALTVTEEPKYPSAQEVAEQVVLQVANHLAEFQRQTGEIVNLQNRNLETQWFLIVFNVTVNVAVLLALLFWLRPRLEKTYRR